MTLHRSRDLSARGDCPAGHKLTATPVRVQTFRRKVEFAQNFATHRKPSRPCKVEIKLGVWSQYCFITDCQYTAAHPPAEVHLQQGRIPAPSGNDKQSDRTMILMTPQLQSEKAINSVCAPGCTSHPEEPPEACEPHCVTTCDYRGRCDLSHKHVQ